MFQRVAFTDLGGNMTTETETHDGPGLALAVLYEANDLLNVLREHHSETVAPGKEASGRHAAQWTLTGEISRRLNSAIAHLDDAVPHPADAIRDNCRSVREMVARSPKDGDGALLALADELEHDADWIEAAAPDLRDTLDELESRIRWTDGVLGIIVCDRSVENDISSAAAGAQQHLAEAQDMLERANALLRKPGGKTGGGATSLAETRRRLEAACAGMSAEECSQRLQGHLLYVSRNLAADVGDDFTVTETCTLKGLRSMVAGQEVLQAALPDYEPTELYRRAVNGAAQARKVVSNPDPEPRFGGAFLWQYPRY